jgi:hypothetical protein
MNHSGMMDGEREGMYWNGNICREAGIQQLRLKGRNSIQPQGHADR